MLDQRHDDLANPAHDHNAYTLGAMHKHNVVIVCLPKGEVGTNSAAAVATRMISTFPSIRFGLMVGIGGGVPPNVRLGDVVVITPANGFPGVVQWDMGKAEQMDTFTQTGALNTPPSAVLTALTKLECKHDMEGSSISQYLEEIALKWPRLAPKYTRSETLEDVCFEANYNHATNEGKKRTHEDPIEWRNEDACCRFCDRSRALKRQPREMVVHYGLIASGNQVIKDATFRDKINSRMGGNILCFEMEAAGLMNNFPCAVIRGICDYCDSHKNNGWQEHAAAVAAAFAKELLSVIPPARVTDTRAAAEVMKHISDGVDLIRRGLFSLQSTQEDQHRKTLRCWLSPIDYEAIQGDIYRNYQPGTGKWFLDDFQFTHWLATPSETLFCTGIQGVGKTMMTAMVVDNLRARFLHTIDSQHVKIGIVFLYCIYERKNEQKSDDLLASILSQLALEQETIPKSIRELYNRHHQGRTRPSKQELSNEIHSIMEKYDTVFVVVDALDECGDDATRQDILCELFQLQQISDTRLMFTSRPNILPEHDGMRLLTIYANEKDVRRYLRSQIGHLSKVVEGDEVLQHKTETRIVESANGIFLLAQLYMSSLRGKETKKAIYRELDQMGTGNEGLDQAYHSAYNRIDSELARSPLCWVVCARRVLTADELQHALAIEPGTRSLDPTNFYDLQEIVSSCACLMVVDTISKNIRLVHATAKDYFQRKSLDYFPDAQKNIAASCLTYLGYAAFEHGACPNDETFEERLQQFPVFDYASRYWGHHCRDVEGSIQTLATALFLHKGRTSSASQCLFISESRRFSYSQRTPMGFTGVHLASYFGLHNIIAYVII
ncbi:purine and uridine phosphorylase [Aspergillus sclerotiicarbonarius CBS 121057]|uniref:Purine and uridine phosphorylase n=1 Tax=Aspergillus sclerotiicarbonarius (strain CBS 121057 / IBT 28362) TaxID=1448318 RepID=A0A319E325_ASPSB|nr:purine and uridine phosphorylase [Aspergillus sclerotiicarbonarius CBS 121057]